jgi:hypothetical protein
VIVNDIKDALRQRATAAGLELSAAVVDYVAMATMKFIQERKSVTAVNPELWAEVGDGIRR